MLEQFTIANPLSSGGKSFANSFSFLSSSLRVIPGEFKRTERIAWVAHALLIICKGRTSLVLKDFT
jgi:hypothetical protein